MWIQDFYNWFFLQEGRTPEGYMSWQHLVSVTITILIFFSFAIFLGIKFKNNKKGQTGTLLGFGIALVFVYLLKTADIIVSAIIKENIQGLGMSLANNIPIFLCDITIVMVPIAALTKGKVREVCCDFICTWGLVMGLVGNYLAGNIYSSSCVISFPTMISLLNHTLSGAVTVFLFITKLAKLDIKNIPFNLGILYVVMFVALVVDYTLRINTGGGQNYMFFFGGDGTPYDLIMMLTQNNYLVYQRLVFILQTLYVFAFYGIYHLILAIITKSKSKNVKNEIETATNA